MPFLRRAHPAGGQGVQALPRHAVAAGLAALLIALPCAADQVARSARVRAEFQRVHPCPSTGKTTGKCPGFIADHITPLCAGGADSVRNLQWQSIRAARAKDTKERRLCRLKNSRLIDKRKQ
ncbi:MAG: HNH endonuclease signature motif containing protein [Anaerolineae bacterium]